MSIDRVMRFTKSQMTLLIKKINKRKQHERDFQISIHGGKPRKKGLNVQGAIPIEHVIENQQKNKKTI
jgi:hypothetical protein